MTTTPDLMELVKILLESHNLLSVQAAAVGGNAIALVEMHRALLLAIEKGEWPSPTELVRREAKMDEALKDLQALLAQIAERQTAIDSLQKSTA